METKRLIKISGNRVFLTPELCLNLSQTSLVGAHLTFRAIQDIYLEVEVLRYDSATSNISLNVIDYNPTHTDKFKDQTAKGKVAYIYFTPLKWQHIEKHLSSYTKTTLLKTKIVVDDTIPAQKYEGLESPWGKLKEKVGLHTGYSTPYSGKFENEFPNTKERTPFIEKLIEEAKIYFEDADFNPGFVTFPYTSKNLGQVYNLKIENPFLRKEFNVIKPYFSKAFGGKKRFAITVIFTCTDYVVTDIHTSSVEIESIDESIIDSIKYQRVAKLTSTPLRQLNDKSLFTAEDIFDSFDEDLKEGNVFGQSEEDILNFLIQTRDIRNAKHLQFLSGSLHSSQQKLRFTLKPLFGFLFFIEGKTNNHFCWELLNSHATYLWSFDKIQTDIESQFKRIEQTIGSIINMGRETYKRDYRSNKMDNDLTFSTIEHSNISAAANEGFAMWQQKLTESLLQE